MDQSYHTSGIQEDESFSIKKELQKAVRSFVYVLSYWRLLLIIAVIGAVTGLLYRWLKPISYTARTTFVVEESKMGGGSIASALAGQLGLDIGSLGGSSSGILSGDNVLELVKSRSLIKKTLLSDYDSSGNSLADKYAETRKWKEKWKDDSKVGRVVNFKTAVTKPSRTEDSLLQVIITEIIQSDLRISKPDKKLGFFEMSTAMRDERLSFLFCQRLLKTATDFYIDTKTRRLSNNVNRLQAKADSLERALDRKTYSAADASRQLLDANPVYSAPEVSAEIKYRDKLMQGTIYAKIIENLEISKAALIQETPTIQIVDGPEIPLEDNRIKFIAALVAGGFIAVAIAMVLLVFAHSWKAKD